MRGRAVLEIQQVEGPLGGGHDDPAGRTLTGVHRLRQCYLFHVHFDPDDLVEGKRGVGQIHGRLSIASGIR
jgi:hypothetical protein